MRVFSDGVSDIADPYLARAATLALQARGATAPNPLVGCVIVADGRIVGEGFHPKAGEPHAEVFALRQAGSAARGATAYVTLEPCAHQGRTPPCADALIAAGVARVVIGMPDPHGLAAGGAERLRCAGIDIAFAEDPSPFVALNEGWLSRITTGLPFVTVKAAVSLDARLSFEPRRPAVITGAHGARVTRQLRAASDAVLVSAATVSADNPALTVRDADGQLASRQPLRVVLARKELPSIGAKLFSDNAAATLLLASDEIDDELLAPFAERVRVERWRADSGLASALAVLGGLGIGELLVEAGPRLLTALYGQRLLDQLVVVTAGGFAGPKAPEMFLGKADRTDDTLTHAMVAFEAAVVGDVAATVWRNATSTDRQEV